MAVMVMGQCAHVAPRIARPAHESIAASKLTQPHKQIVSSSELKSWCLEPASERARRIIENERKKWSRGESNPLDMPPDDAANAVRPLSRPQLIEKLTRRAEVAHEADPEAVLLVLTEAITQLEQIEAQPREGSHAS